MPDKDKEKDPKPHPPQPPSEPDLPERPAPIEDPIVIGVDIGDRPGKET